MRTHEITPRHRAVHLPKVLGQAFGLSRSEVRRLIDAGALRVDGQVWHNDQGLLSSFSCTAGDLDGRVVRLGRRRWIRFTAPPG